MWDRVLSAILVVAILGALGTLVYTMATPKVGEGFTEFYLLGLSGQAKDYPTRLKVGEPGRVIVGIGNREQEVMTYRVEVRIDGVMSNQAGPITLAPDKKWQDIVAFTPTKVGDKQEVEFLLYKQGQSPSREGQSEVYQSLHLWLDVR